MARTALLQVQRPMLSCHFPIHPVPIDYEFALVPSEQRARYVKLVTPAMTTITTASLELALVGNGAPPSTLLFSLVDDMGTGESLKDEAIRTDAKGHFRPLKAWIMIKQVGND